MGDFRNEKGNVSNFFFSRSWEFVLQTVSYQISSCSWQDGTETSTDLYVFESVKKLYILYILVNRKIIFIPFVLLIRISIKI